MRCVAYCRVSTDERDQLNSFKNQRDHYLELFFKNSEYTPAQCGMLYKKDGTKEVNCDAIFADEGISGTKLKNREAFKAMIECARNGEFDRIFVKNASRFSRYVADGVSVLKELKGLQVEVYFESERLSSLDSNTERYIGHSFLNAQSESQDKSMSIKFGQMESRKRGGWCGANVYGYNRASGTLHINEEEAEVVRLIYNLYLAEGKGTGGIARILNNSGVPTKRGTVWSDTTIKGILKNVLYTGLMVTFKSTNTDINMTSDRKSGKNYIRQTSEDEQIKFENPTLQIIEKDLFERVRHELERRSTACKNTGHKVTDKLLSQLFVCGHCKSTYVRKQRGVKADIERLGYYWTCRDKDKRGVCQHNYRLFESDLIEMIKCKIIEMKQTDFSGEFQTYLNIYYRYEPDRIDQIQTELKKVTTLIDRNFELYSAEETAKEDYLRRDNTYTEQRAALTQEYNKIVNYKAIRAQAERDYQEYLQCIQSIDLNNLTNKALKTIFRKIIIRSYGRPLQGYCSETLLVAEFDFNFLDSNINTMLDDLKKSTLSEEEHNKLFNSIRFCNFEAVPFKRGGMHFVPKIE